MQSITKTVIVDGQTITFSRLTLEELTGIAEQVSATKEKFARDLAKTEKLDRYEVANLLLEIRSKGVSVAEVLAGCDTSKGALQVLRASLTKSGVVDPAAQSTLIAKISTPEALEISRMIVMDQQDETAVDEAKDPLDVGDDTPVAT